MDLNYLYLITDFYYTCFFWKLSACLTKSNLLCITTITIQPELNTKINTLHIIQ